MSNIFFFANYETRKNSIIKKGCAYTKERFRRPPYLSVKACGESKCNIVTYGVMPALET